MSMLFLMAINTAVSVLLDFAETRQVLVVGNRLYQAAASQQGLSHPSDMFLATHFAVIYVVCG